MENLQKLIEIEKSERAMELFSVAQEVMGGAEPLIECTIWTLNDKDRAEIIEKTYDKLFK